MCSPNFEYIEGYHFGRAQILEASGIDWPSVFLEVGGWILLGALVVAVILVWRRYHHARKYLIIAAAVATIIVIGAFFMTAVSYPCGPFELRYPTNEASIKSILETDGMINSAYFHLDEIGLLGNPVNVSETPLRFVCVTAECSEALDISADGKVLRILRQTEGLVYSCQGSNDISIAIPPTGTWGYSYRDQHEFIPENCTIWPAG